LDEIESRNAPRTTPKRQEWLDRIEGWRREWEAPVATGYTDGATPINPPRAAHEINGASSPTTRSSSAISACTTTGSYNSASRAARPR
jgi:hypothetical protein